jgi:uncharacterized protein (DUF1778 family)
VGGCDPSRSLLLFRFFIEHAATDSGIDCQAVRKSDFAKEPHHEETQDDTFSGQIQCAGGPARCGEPAALAAAAELRRISVSDYVRIVTVAQAHREVAGARDQTTVLSRDEQLAFWQALNAPGQLTPSQKRQGAIMRGAK